mgnify:CR=1 FL=1
MRTREEMEAEIRGLQQLLAATDYKALKHADGALTDEESEPTRARRGEIFTSDGTVIASNDYAETVYIQVDSELNIASRSTTCRQRLRRSRPPKGRW